MLDLLYSTNFDNEIAPVYANPQEKYKSVQADSIKSYYAYFNGLQPGISAANYNQQGKISTFRFIYSSQNERTYNYYTASGNLKSSFKLNVLNDTIKSLIYTYNATESAIIADTSTLNGTFFYARSYHYNAQSQLDSVYELRQDGNLIFMPSDLTTLEYNANGKVEHMESFAFDPSGIAVHYIDSFGYAGNLDYNVFQQTYTLIPGNDTFGNITIKYPGVNNCPDSIVTYYNPDTAYLYYATIKFSYNDFNNPVLLNIRNINNICSQISFYYETFGEDTTTTPSAIHEVNSKNAFSVFPNPFTDNLNIYWKTSASANASLSLVNSLGQIIFSTKMNLITGSNTVNTGQIIPGNYLLLIEDKKGNTFTGKISKQ